VAYINCAAQHDGVDIVEIVNQVRLPEVDVVPGRSELLGDEAGDLRGCAVLAGCRDENSDGGPLSLVDPLT
jgi:hypothetical protein